MEKEFTHLINVHSPIIYKVCNLYYDNAEDRRDLFQEIVLQLWKSFKNFRHEAKWSTWMYKVALNTAISNFRKDSRKPDKKSLSASEFQIPDLNESSAADKTMRALYSAISKLTSIEKAVIMLYLEEKTYEEIGDILGVSKSNVGVKLNRIKNKLEKLIKAENYELG